MKLFYFTTAPGQRHIPLGPGNSAGFNDLLGYGRDVGSLTVSTSVFLDIDGDPNSLHQTGKVRKQTAHFHLSIQASREPGTSEAKM